MSFHCFIIEVWHEHNLFHLCVLCMIYSVIFVKGLCKKLPNRLSTWHFNLNEYFYRAYPGTLYDTWSARSSMAVGWLMTTTSASWTHLRRCGSMRTCSALISTSTKATAFPDAIVWTSISNTFRWDKMFQWNCSVSLFGVSTICSPGFITLDGGEKLRWDCVGR